MGRLFDTCMGMQIYPAKLNKFFSNRILFSWFSFFEGGVVMEFLHWNDWRPTAFSPYLKTSFPPLKLQLYEIEGGTLTRDFVVGKDLLESSPALQEMRDQKFLSENSLSRIFTHTVNGNPKPFKEGLKSFMRMTNRIHDLAWLNTN